MKLIKCRGQYTEQTLYIIHKISRILFSWLRNHKVSLFVRIDLLNNWVSTNKLFQKVW